MIKEYADRHSLPVFGVAADTYGLPRRMPAVAKRTAPRYSRRVERQPELNLKAALPVATLSHNG
jgi:hypothetical protein